jgi:Flp pilus assembly protein TadG
MALRRLRRDDGGAVVMELVIILPVLFALVLGITTGGHAYSTKIAVVEAVREGARFGASLQLGTGPTAVSDYEASVRSRVVSASGGSLTSADVCVRLVLPTGAADCGVTDPAGASAESTVHLVKVSASTSATIQFFFSSTTTSLGATLAARYERDTG